MTVTNRTPPDSPSPAALGCEALRDDLLCLLYGEGTPSEIARARSHLDACAKCRADFSALETVRTDLQTWTVPPEARGNLTRGAFGSERATLAAQKTKAQPAWTQWTLAAAAGLVAGLGLAVAGSGLFAQRDGSRGAAATQSGSPVSLAQVRTLLDEREQKHRQELQDLRRRVDAFGARPAFETSAVPRLPGGDTRVTPVTFDRLLRESEDRQTRILEARLAQLRREAELQRQYDLAQVAAGLAFIDSRTGAEAARTSELMKNLVRVTSRPQER